MSEGITGDHKNDLLDDSIGLPILRRISSGYIATSTWTLATSSAFSESTAEALTRHQKTYLVPGSAEIARRCIITYIHLRRLRGRGGKLTEAYADFSRRGGGPLVVAVESARDSPVSRWLVRGCAFVPL